MKRLLFIGMMCLMSIGAYPITPAYFFNCTVHYSVVDEQGHTIHAQDITADTCAHALKIARWCYYVCCS